MGSAPKKLRWTVSSLNCFAIANLAAGMMLLLSDQVLTRGLVLQFPWLAFLLKTSGQLSFVVLLGFSAVACWTAVGGLHRRKSWSWSLAAGLLVLSALGWCAGIVTFGLAVMGLLGLFDREVRQWVQRPAAQLVTRSNTIRLDFD